MKRFLIILLSCYSIHSSAQQTTFQKLYAERDGLLSSYLIKEISFHDALKKSSNIHSNFRQLGFNGNANEEAMYKGFLYHFNNQKDSSQIILKKGLALISSKNDTLNFKYLALIASLYRSSNEMDSAQFYFKKGYQLLLQNPNFEKQIPNEIVSFYNDFMFFLNTNGENKLRKVILDKAYLLASNLEKKDYLGFIENHLAYLHHGISEFENAERMYLLSISHTSKPFYRLIRYLNLADLYQLNGKWGQYEMLIPKIKNDLSRVLSNSNEFENVRLKNNILYVKWLLHKNEIQVAKSLLLNQTRANVNFRTKYESEAYLLLAQNSNSLEYGNLMDNAISSSLIDRNIKNLTVGNVLFSQSLISALKQKVLHENTSKSKIETREVLNLISQIQKAFPFEETKYSYQEEMRPFIGQLLLQSKGNASEIFEFIEYGKAGVISQVIADQDIKIGNVDARLLQKERKLEKQLTKLRVELIQKPKSPDSLINRISEIRIQQSFLEEEIEQQSLEYYQLKYKKNIPEIIDLQNNLNVNQAILNYYKQDQMLYVVLLKKNEFSATKTSLPREFDNLLKAFLNGIYLNPGLGAYKQHKEAKFLYFLLLGKSEKELNGITELIILRDEELNQLPFEVLETPKGEFLLDKYAISYNYSASLAFQQFKKKKLNGLIAFAPYASGSFLQNSTRDLSLGSLPFSALEVERINGTIYRNQSATKNRFIENYQKHGIIHFATHAQMDDTDPSRSFIAFYPDSTDYKLYTEELYNLSLRNTQLVVLSACEAGGGKLQKGEGLMSLARGFAYAGCPSVITTLWKANDETTAWLSERLHHYLNKGWNKAEALRQAKIDFRASDTGKEYDHPYYWANFILIGDEAPLQLSFWDLYKWWIVGIVILLLLTVAYLGFAKNNQFVFGLKQ